MPPSSPCIGSGAHVARILISYYHGVLDVESVSNRVSLTCNPVVILQSPTPLRVPSDINAPDAKV
jgi:hypothetical protein